MKQEKAGRQANQSLSLYEVFVYDRHRCSRRKGERGRGRIRGKICSESGGGFRCVLRDRVGREVGWAVISFADVSPFFFFF